MKLGEEEYYGIGLSHKKAKQDAATTALSNTKYKKPPIKVKNVRVNDEGEEVSTSKLNEFALKLGLSIRFVDGKDPDVYEDIPEIRYHNIYEKTKTKPYKRILNLSDVNNGTVLNGKYSHLIDKTFYITLRLGDSKYLGKGLSKQSARENAASKALTDVNSKSIEEICGADLCDKRKAKTPLSFLNEAAQRKGWSIQYEIKEEGPSHQKTFFVECKLNDYATSGFGKTKKEAKHLAAEKMIGILNEEDPSALISQRNVEEKKIKRKKKKVKASFLSEVKKSIVDGVSLIGGSFWQGKSEYEGDLNFEGGSVEIKDENKNNFRHKGNLLDLCNKLRLECSFIEIGEKNLVFYSLLSIDTNPSYVRIFFAIHLLTFSNFQCNFRYV